ncbi:SdpI family protein [Oceanivirga miroungae]|uniref:Immunity protein SdpI n=1 Tax=Oceanivirga miroungae TaxID=1130046 RepID=A0A6I8M4Z8_9FUSO|nr:SdpI family protein [Oceanivirga miroungae]VWL84996.1 Immunity protein SdpI [Oceanivirga miroungae]
MIKNYRKIFIVSLLCLIPLIYSIPIYQSIPSLIPTHWDFNGNIDGYTSKKAFVFIAPIASFLLNIIVSTFMYLDPRNIDNKAKLKDIYIVIIPVLLNILYLVSLLVSFNYDVNISMIVKIILGLLFIILGNYTLGIKTPWTLNDDEIWNKTNKLGGKILFIIGFILIFSIAMKNNKGFLILFMSSLSLLFIPVIYSYILYVKKNK